MFGSLQFPRVKMLLHALQGFVVFLGWALTIAVLTQKGGTDGRTAYYFALVCEDLSRGRQGGNQKGEAQT